MREPREPSDPAPPVFDQQEEVASPVAGSPGTDVEPAETDVEPAAAEADAVAPVAATTGARNTMIPARERRRTAIERVSMRIVATCGVIGINTALGAILVSSDVQGWIVGLAVSANSVLLAALLWSSRQL